MKRFDSIRIQQLATWLGVACVVAVVIGGILIMAMQQAQRQQQNQAITTATTALAAELQRQATHLTATALGMAHDELLRAAVTSGDVAAMQTQLARVQHDVPQYSLALLGVDGQRVAASDVAGLPWATFLEAHRAAEVKTSPYVVFTAQGVYYGWMLPLPSPTTPWLALGYPLDAHFAQTLAKRLQLDISVIYNATNPAHFVVSTLAQPGAFTPSSAQPGVAAVAMDSKENVQVWGHLPATASVFGYQIGLAGIAVLLLLGWWWIRRDATTLERSLQQLTQFTKAVSSDLTTPLPRTSDQATQALANSLDQMRTDWAEREQQVIHQSQHCKLTGLSNRLWVELRLPELLQNAGVQLALVNIKDFKHVNDSFGYHNGDSLLQQLALRLADTPRLELVA